MIQAIANKLAVNDFLMRFVVSIDGQSNLWVHSTVPMTNSVNNFTVFGLGDMPAPTNFSCGSTLVSLDRLTGYIGQLNRFFTNAVTKVGPSGVGTFPEWKQGLGWNIMGNCDAAKQAARDYWNNSGVSWESTTTESIRVRELTAQQLPGLMDTSLRAVRGKLYADLSSNPTNWKLDVISSGSGSQQATAAGYDAAPTHCPVVGPPYAGTASNTVSQAGSGSSTTTFTYP